MPFAAVTIRTFPVLCLRELLMPDFPIFGSFIVMQKVQQIEAHESLTI